MNKRLRAMALAASMVMGALSTVAVPAEASPPALEGIAAGVPDTSPAAASRTYETYIASCSSGYVCAAIPYGDGYFNFKFYAYGTYRLYNWLGFGSIVDKQTGTASTRTLNASGRQLACWNAGGASSSYDWTPVEYIQLTQSRC